ncbi:hypothetical protein Fot_14117 [Forsythia ovata]|uniref:Uncharacterized protein n=1 Tax=Forsythia ovata TaxID=205694 RepID=A0ABD1W5G6_9LAMI
MEVVDLVEKMVSYILVYCGIDDYANGIVETDNSVLFFDDLLRVWTVDRAQSPAVSGEVVPILGVIGIFNVPLTETAMVDPIPKRKRSYPTPEREIPPNLDEEGYYRPGGPTSIYQVLPRYLRSYSTPKMEVLPNIHEEGHYHPGGPTSISQVLPNSYEM